MIIFVSKSYYKMISVFKSYQHLNISLRGSGLPSRKLLTKALGGLRMMMLLSAVLVLQFSEVAA